MKNYMAFMLGNHLIFLDGFQFMASSLERLATNLLEDKFKYTSRAFRDEKFGFDEKERCLSI